MKRSYFARPVIALLLLTTLILTGCGTLKSVTPKAFRGNETMLKKRVLVVPITNMAGLSDQKAAQLTESWVKLLKKDNSLSVTLLTEFKGPQSTTTSSERGVVTDPELIKKSEEMGMNVLITQVLEPFDYTAKKRGIWPFRKNKGEYAVAMLVNAVDIINGTLIVSSRNTDAIKMGPVPEGEKTPPQWSDAAMNEVLDDILESQASTIQKTLEKQEWREKITLVDGKIRINGGAEIGVTKGSVFEVFDKGSPVKSIAGKEYYVQGMKIGEVTVTDVSEDHAFAAPVGDKIFENGQIVSLKNK
jgi:hypothetical protein